MLELLKSGLQSDSVETRLETVDKIDANDASNQSILSELAASDSDSEVRHSALNKLTDPSVLLSISKNHSDTTTQQQAESALHHLLGAKSPFSEAKFKELISANPELTLSVAKFCPHVDVRHSIIESLSDAQQAELIAEIDYTESRQRIAERLTDIELLEQARKRLKGKDKSAEKIIKSKLDAHHGEQKQQQENLEASTVICEKMEYLASKESHPNFEAQFNVWTQRWDSLEFTPNEDIASRYSTAHKKAASDLANDIKIAAVINKQKSLAKELTSYCHQLAALSWSALNEESSKLTEILTNSSSQWAELLNDHSASDSVLAEFNDNQTSLKSLQSLADYPIPGDKKSGKEGGEKADTEQHPQQLSRQKSINSLNQAITAINWSKKHPDLTAVTEAKQVLTSLEMAVKDNVQQAAKALDKLHKRINRLLGSTNRGDLKQAKGELIAIGKAVKVYEGKDRKALDERLEKAGEAVSKMGDWKDFATEPKFIELCEAMDKLTKSKTHPDNLAKKIATLQQQWKALGHSESADTHWDRFKAAADKAYEPCATFFEERHNKRAKNLEQREPLVTQMQDLAEKTNWDDSPDYKKVEARLKSITNAWQKIKDVERDAGQKQWDRLCTYRSAVYAKLDLVYDENIELKNKVIEQASSLLKADVNDNTFDKLKFIQSRWKQVGVTRRKQDQAAWKNFKKTTDAVYEKIQDARQSKRAKEDEQLVGYRQIINDIKALAKHNTELAKADTRFDQLQADYKELPPFPKGLSEKVIEGIGKDYKRACDGYSNARQRIQKNEQNKTLDTLNKKAELCAELEKSTKEQDIERLSSELNDIVIPNNELSKRFEARLQSALSTDRSEANQARKRLCLDLEILLDVESPTEDKGLRMQVQLERMKNSGIGHNTIDKNSQLEELKLNWLCLPGAEPELQTALEQRFQKALKSG